MPLKLENKGFERVLAELQELLEMHYKVQMHIAIAPDFKKYNFSLQLALYRIIQELCSNSIKHGKCTDIQLDFKLNDAYLLFEYRDNGKGFDVENYNTSRMGMSNIYYRIFQFSG